MKLIELLEHSNGDLDCAMIIADVDMPADFCWNSDYNGFTDEGKEFFAPLLESEIKLRQTEAGIHCITVFCDNEELGEFFSWAAAGYISESSYNKYFIEK